VFGCDICQDVCPWNGGVTDQSPKAPATQTPEFQPRAGLVNPQLEQIAGMSREEFQKNFRGSPVKRARYSGLRRNAVSAMGNSGAPGFLPQLGKLAEDPDGDVADHARWAMQEIQRSQSQGPELCCPPRLDETMLKEMTRANSTP
jgi:epoxyqueuosine reductase